MKRLLIIVAMVLPMALLMAPTPVMAKPQIVSWQWPTLDCDSASLAAVDLIEGELIVDTAPMPMPSDTNGACDATLDPDAPASATIVPISVADTSAILNLQPGVTYYFRIRVSAYVNGNWSSWATEISKTVPYGRPDVAILSANGPVQQSYYLITDPAIRLN